MKVALNTQNVLKNIPPEEHLLEMSSMESLYAIRKLKALVENCSVGLIDVKDEINKHGQVYSEKYEIWFNAEEVHLLDNSVKPLTGI